MASAGRWRRALARPVSLPFSSLSAWGAAAALLALTAVLFFELLFRGRVLYDRDVHLYIYPRAETIVRTLALGSWPLWNPYVGFGEPLLANSASQVLYPATWLNLLAVPWTGYTLSVAGHFLFTTLSLYRLGRAWALSPGAAVVAAAVWGLSGPYLSLVNNGHHFAGASWMPCVLLASERALRAPDRRHVALWAAAAAAQMLAGSADMSLLTNGLVAANLLWRLDWRQPTARRNRVLAGVSALAAVTALALTCLQWLPSLEMARRSSRWSLPDRVRSYWSMHPAVVPALLLPVRLDRLPLHAETRATLFESREPFLYSLYLGLPAAGLVLASFTAPPSPRRRLLVLAALGFLLLALGRHGPLFGPVSQVPPASLLRYPVKATIGLAFCFALLAGQGLDASRALRTRGARLLRIAGALALLALAVTGILWMARSTAAALIIPRVFPDDPWSLEALRDIGHDVLGTLLVTAIGLLAWVGLRRRRVLRATVLAATAVVDLLAFHRRLNPTAPAEVMALRPPLLDALRPRPLERFYVYDYSILSKSEEHLGHARYLLAEGQPNEPWRPSLALRLALYPTVLSTWGLEGSYDLDQQGLYPSELAFLTRLLRRVEGTPAHTRLLRMGSVSRVLALHARGFDDLRPTARFRTLFVEPLHEFQVPDPMPRTYAVDGSRVATGEAAFRILVEEDLDPRREVIVESGGAGPGSSDAGQSRIVAWKPDRVTIEAELTRPAVVVLVDAYDPGWRATVDGVPSPVLKANVAFRAVRAGAGRHRIEYVYRPTSVLIGSIVSLLAIVALGWLAIGRPAIRGGAMPAG